MDQMDYGAVLPASLMVFFAIDVFKILLPGRNCKLVKYTLLPNKYLVIWTLWQDMWLAKII